MKSNNHQITVSVIQIQYKTGHDRKNQLPNIKPSSPSSQSRSLATSRTKLNQYLAHTHYDNGVVILKDLIDAYGVLPWCNTQLDTKEYIT